MAWQGNRAGSQWSGQHGKKKGNGATTGAFKTKKNGLYIARFNGKYFDAALKVFMAASKQSEPSVVVFINKNERKSERDPILRLGLDVDKPMERGGRIRDERNDDPQMEEFEGERDDVDFDNN